MPELQHFATTEEAIAMLRDVVDKHHVKLVPEESRLAEPRIETFDAVTSAVIEKLENYRIVELEGSFTKFPLHFNKRQSGAAAGTYYVDDTIGPRLSWFLPGVVDDDSRGRLVPGSFSYRDHYMNARTHQWEPAADDVRVAFEAIVETLKCHMIRVDLRKGVRVWVGKATKRQLDDGQLFIER